LFSGGKRRTLQPRIQDAFHRTVFDVVVVQRPLAGGIQADLPDLLCQTQNCPGRFEPIGDFAL
jgi:hypothetical protein